MPSDVERAYRAYLNTLVLAMLESGALHGQGLLDALHQRSDGRININEANAYPALHRLEHFGLVTSAWTLVGGRSKRKYELTPEGHRKLADDRDAWRDFAGAIATILRL